MKKKPLKNTVNSMEKRFSKGEVGRINKDVARETSRIRKKKKPVYQRNAAVCGICETYHDVMFGDRRCHGCPVYETQHPELIPVCGTCADWRSCDATEGWRMRQPCSGIGGVKWRPKIP